MVRMAVFGAGVIGKLRCATIGNNPSTRLVAVADTDLARARSATHGTEAVAVDDYHQLLSDHDVDAVVVSSPVHLHEEMCLAAFEAGCDVLCEKPLSNSLDSCKRILQKSRESDKVLAVGFNHRYYPAVKFLVQAIAEGRIGTIDHLRVFGGHDGLAGFRADWMFKGPLSGGGAMMDVGIHMTDLINYVAGNVVEVSGVSTGSIWNVEGSEDNAMAIMRTERGIPVLYQATWTEWKGYQFFLDVYGDKGMVRAAYAPMANLLITQAAPGEARTRTRKFYPEIILREKLRGWQTTTRISFEEELRDFLAMRDGATVPLADGRAGVLANEVAQGVYRSSRAHETVVLGAQE